MEPRAFSVKDALQLPETDPARVWVFVADLFNLPKWTSARKVEAAPELPLTGDMLSAVHGIPPMRRRVQYEVLDWEAGRRFLLRLSGLRYVSDAQLECRVESVVEPDRPSTRIEIRISGAANQWLVGPLESQAQRRVAAGLRKLEKEFR